MNCIGCKKKILSNNYRSYNYKKSILDQSRGYFFICFCVLKEHSGNLDQWSSQFAARLAVFVD